jgi:hypothetical protein
MHKNRDQEQWDDVGDYQIFEPAASREQWVFYCSLIVTMEAGAVKYGSQHYGFKLLKREQRLQRDTVYAANVREGQERAKQRVIASWQWDWIRRNDLPENFVNDRRRYYRSVYLKSEHWKRLRARKLRGSPVCEICGSCDRVEPHHLRYRNLYDVTLEDLRTLCRRHHVLEHKRLEDQKRSKGLLEGVPKTSKRPP